MDVSVPKMKGTIQTGPSCKYKTLASVNEITIWTENRTCSVQNATMQQNDSSIIVTKLMPGNTYFLKINCSDVCCDNFSTNPESVKNISVLDQNNSSVLMVWSAPQGHVDSYEVNISNVGLNKYVTTVQNQSLIQELQPGCMYNLTITSVSGGMKNISQIFQLATKPNPPTEITLIGQTNVSLTLNILMDGPGVAYEVSYKLDQFNTTTILQTNKTVQLTALSPGSQYNMTICTIGVMDLKSSSINITAYTRPNPVSSLNSTSVNTTTVQLTWFYQGESTYEVSVNEEARQNLTGKTANITKLNPGSNYTFTVVAITNNVRSDPTQTSAFTGLDKASNILAVGTCVSMRVEWSGPSGNISFYTVSILQNGTIIQTKKQTDTTPVMFSSLLPGTLYTVNVGITSGPVNVDGGSVQNATLPSPPGMPNITQQTTDSLNISWSQPLNMSSVDYGYRVLYWCNNSNSSICPQNCLNVSGSKNSITLTGLTAGSPYVITVQTVGALGYLSSSYQIFAYTCPNQVSSVNVDWFSENSIFLSWKQPDTESSKYTYLLTITSPNGTYILQQSVSDITAQLQPLQSASQYNISIITCTADGTQSSAKFITAFTKPLALSGLEAKVFNSTTVWLNWTRPTDFHEGFSYHVGVTNCTESSRSLQVLSENITVSNLQPGTMCLFSVYSSFQGNEGQPVNVSIYTKPFPVNPTISNNGSNASVVVSWNTPFGHVDQYLLNISSEDWESSVLLNNTEHFYTFTQLSAATVYTVKFITISGYLKEASQPISTATYPNKPGSVQVLAKTTNSLLLEWATAQGMKARNFNYSLTYQPNPNFTTFITQNNTFLLTNLQSGTSYNISLNTVGLGGFQSEAFMTCFITTIPDRVKNLRTIYTSTDQLSVEWKGPEGVLSYAVNVVSKWSIFVRKTTTLEWTTVDALVPGTPYNITVQSVTSDNTTGEMELLQVCTDAAPIETVACSGPDLTSPMLNLSWSPPSGSYMSFQIQLVSSTMDRRANTTDLHYMFTGLRYKTYYTATLWTVGCGNKSSAKEIGCTTGVTNPPVPNIDPSVSVADTQYNRFSLIIHRKLFDNSCCSVLYFGILITSDTKLVDNKSQYNHYLTQTYDDWKSGQTSTYLALVYENIDAVAENVELTINIGDETQWNSYRNGPLSAKYSYSFAVVSFTHMVLQNGLVVVSQSYFSVSHFHQDFITLPEAPVKFEDFTSPVGGAVGVVIFLLVIITTAVVLRRSEFQPICVEDYEAHYKKNRTDSFCGFVKEFEDLKLVGISQSKNIALAPENRAKNRYNNVLPYDTSRMKLSVLVSSFDDYINASYIPGYTSKKEFIAAQGPLPCTVNDFWRMIWEKNIHTLVMLTRCNEQGRVKCEKYWSSETSHFNALTVTITSEIIMKEWTIRDLDVKNVKTAETRSIRHFHFTAWPDHGVPETTELLINFRHVVREHMDQYSCHTPTLVHCSAGVGRTGTFIAIDRLIYQIEREGVVDVYGIIHDLRMHRPLMVQTEDQYVFLNQCAVYIIRSRNGRNVDFIYQNAAALTIYENLEHTKKSNKK
ncbi:receptor-type tyrosine-protein phosphatase eta [Trichomycterus rosablanca]|uniref:receptor-type tyrosine-protein phosphatase eta n=1 Tax=Trichomycterus rosablanca TaxID=2290929 RepID=UPI002F35ABA0